MIPSFGVARVVIFFICFFPSLQKAPKAPPQKVLKSAGARTIPKIATPSFSIKAIFTVNSSRWLTNSLVPSNASTNQNVPLLMSCRSPAEYDSSPIAGILGVNWARPFSIIDSAFSSASVTSDLSDLLAHLLYRSDRTQEFCLPHL